MPHADRREERRPRRRDAVVDGRFLFGIIRTHEGNPTRHVHPAAEWEVCYVLSGEGRYFIDKTSYPMRPGDVFLVNDKEIHRVVAEKIDRVTILLAHRFVERVAAYEKLKFERLFVRRPDGRSNLVLLEEEEKAEASFLVTRLSQATPSAGEGSLSLCVGYLTALLSIVWQAFLRGRQRPHVFSATEALVRTMAEYIDEHVRDELSLARLAAKAGVTPTYFSSVFKKVTGMSLVTYITLKRLELAKELLRTTDLKVSYVSLDVGFNDLSHFNRVFKREMRLTPLQYRKICKE